MSKQNLQEQRNTSNTMDILLDIETLATSTDSAIFEIAAVGFNPETGEAFPDQSIELCINPYTQNRDIDPNTLAWHEKKGTSINEVHHNQDLKSALADLCIFFESIKPKNIWAWGSTFDFPILDSAFADCNIKSPWKYYQCCCARTVYRLAFGAKRRPARTHVALDDCLAAIDDLHIAQKHLLITNAESIKNPLITAH